MVTHNYKRTINNYHIWLLNSTAILLCKIGTIWLLLIFVFKRYSTDEEKLSNLRVLSIAKNEIRGNISSEASSSFILRPHTHCHSFFQDFLYPFLGWIHGFSIWNPFLSWSLSRGSSWWWWPHGERKEKEKKVCNAQNPEGSVREKEGDRFCLRKRVFCLSYAKFVVSMNTCYVYYFWKKKEK